MTPGQHQVTILCVTDSGCEEACALEIGRWTKARTTRHRNVVELRETLETAAVLGYHLQTARRVLVQITNPLDDIEHQEPEHLDLLFPPELTFKAEADVLALRLEHYADKKAQEKAKQGNNEENEEEHAHSPLLLPQELIEEVGGWMHSLGRNVKLTHPDIIVYAVATEEGIRIGIDVVGRPLAKRDYRVMLSRRSLKSTVAAATVLYAGAKEGETILDPLGEDGTLAIEAALLLSRTSPLQFCRGFAFEKFPAFAGRDWDAWKKEQNKRGPLQRVTAYGTSLQEMKAIRTNSKLAGVEKDIHATKVTMEWVETKFAKDSIDRIITAPIPSGKSIPQKHAEKYADELFYQAEFVLKKNKTMTCITEKPGELLVPAKKYGFSVVERRPVLMGKRRMAIITFKNGKRKEDKDESTEKSSR